MQRFSDTARRLFQRSPSAETRRLAFQQEFGQFPPHFEATPAEREEFTRTIVQPLLIQRAQEIDRSGSAPETRVAFDRAYESAVSLKLTGTGKTYADFLTTSDQAFREHLAARQ